MGAIFFFKCNPKVGKALGLTGFERYTFADGTMLLFLPDMLRLDRERFFADEAGLLEEIGAVKLTDPEAKREQENPRIRLPEAKGERWRWEQPDISPEDRPADAEQGDAETEAQTETEPEEGAEDGE